VELKPGVAHLGFVRRAMRGNPKFPGVFFNES